MKRSRSSGGLGPNSQLPISSAMRVRSSGGDASKRSSSLSNRPSSFGIGSNMQDYRLMSSGGSGHRPRPSISHIPRVAQAVSRPGTGTAGGGEHMKDPRPLSDKSYRDSCIVELLEFLAERGLQSIVSHKNLSNPSSTDFVKVFEILVGFIIPNYKLGKKRVEDEVPKLLKDIGYPYHIPRSYMITIGAQHTWPTILGSLIWLKKVIEITERCDYNSIMFPHLETDRGHVPESKLQFEFIMKCYNHFMAGNDTYEEQIEELKKNLVTNLGLEDIDKDIEEIERDTARNKLTLDDLENQPNELANLQDQKAALSVDVGKMERYQNQLQTVYSDQINIAKQLEEEEKALLMELSRKESVLKDKMDVISQQGAAGVDAHKMNLKHTSLRRRLANREQFIKDVDTEMHKYESLLMDRREQMISGTSPQHQSLLIIATSAAEKEEITDKVLNELGKVLPKIRAMNPSCDLDLTGEVSGHELNRILNVKGVLEQMNSEGRRVCNENEQKLRELCSRHDNLQECLNDFERQLDELRNKEIKLDEQLSQRKQVHERVMLELQKEIEEKKCMRSSLNAPVSMYASIEDAEVALQRQKDRLEEQNKKAQEELRKKRIVVQTMQKKVQDDHAANLEIVEKRSRELLDLIDKVDEHATKENEEMIKVYREFLNEYATKNK